MSYKGATMKVFSAYTPVFDLITCISSNSVQSESQLCQRQKVFC
jgi:hypothetical protein